MSKIGDYDKWAIQWGYTLFPGNQTAKAEKEILSKWATDSVTNNPRLWFGGEGRDYDPRSQSEDLGDNAMIASAYGIKNLQIIVPQLLDWTKERDSDDYEALSDIYDEVLGQYMRYLYHVTTNIGGIYTTPQTFGQGDDVYAGVSKATQKEALQFLDTYVLNEPEGLYSTAILNKIKAPQVKDPLIEVMETIMASLLNGGRLSRIGFVADRFETKDSYKPEDYMDDLSDLVWEELENRQPINSYRRNVQKAYLVSLLNLYNPNNAKGGMLEVLFAKLGQSYTLNTDIRAIALSHVQSLHKKIKFNIPRVQDKMTKMHLSFLDQQIQDAMGENN